MDSLKTADELFEKYSNCIDYLNNDGSKEENQNLLFDLGFSFALAEHDREIISLIDGLVPSKTIDEWCAYFGMEILDPDGFDRSDMKLYERKFTMSEFLTNSQQSTQKLNMLFKNSLYNLGIALTKLKNRLESEK